MDGDLRRKIRLDDFIRVNDVVSKSILQNYIIAIVALVRQATATEAGHLNILRCTTNILLEVKGDERPDVKAFDVVMLSAEECVVYKDLCTVASHISFISHLCK